MATLAPATGALTVQRVDAGRDARWAAYVAGHPRSVIFHHSRWLRVLEHEYEQPVIALAAVDDDGGFRGVLPLMRTAGLPFGLGSSSGGQRLASLPRTPVAGPLADDDRVTSMLVRAALLETPAGAQLQLKLADPSLDDLAPELTRHPWRMNYAVDLPDQVSDIRFGRSRDHSRLAAACRRSLDAGLSVRTATSLDDVHAWYRLYLETMRHHAVPARRWRLFEAIWESLVPAGMAELLLVELGDRIIAGNVIVSDGDTAFFLFNGADRRVLDRGANNVLQYVAIHRLCASGHRRYDLGEVVEGHDGLARFKKKWGARATRLQRYYSPAPAAPPDPGDDPPSALREAAHAAWRRAPLLLTAAAGTAIFRYL